MKVHPVYLETKGKCHLQRERSRKRCIGDSGESGEDTGVGGDGLSSHAVVLWVHEQLKPVSGSSTEAGGRLAWRQAHECGSVRCAHQTANASLDGQRLTRDCPRGESGYVCLWTEGRDVLRKPPSDMNE